MSAHAYNLQLQGLKQHDVDELARGAAENTSLGERQRALLDYVKVLTLEPAKVRDTHVTRLRKTGWTEEQIFEASFVTAIFAFYNRMSDAYGLDYLPDRWQPPELRAPTTGATK